MYISKCLSIDNYKKVKDEKWNVYETFIYWQWNLFVIVKLQLLAVLTCYSMRYITTMSAQHGTTAQVYSHIMPAVSIPAQLTSQLSKTKTIWGKLHAEKRCLVKFSLLKKVKNNFKLGKNSFWINEKIWNTIFPCFYEIYILIIDMVGLI